jgi:hypothetical protein
VDGLVPAIIAAWRETERAFQTAAEPRRSALADRIHVLQEAHELALTEGVERATVVYFLEEHGPRVYRPRYRAWLRSSSAAVRSDPPARLAAADFPR